jgi:hypothetical protein
MSTDYKKIFGQKDIMLTQVDRDTIASEAESVQYMLEYFNKKQRFIPPVDFTKPKYFARFGSAEKYYIDSIERIYKTYPYDGSLKERIQWELSSSYLDLHLFENEYPRTNGYVNFSPTGWGTIVGSQVNNFGLSDTVEYIQFKGGPHTSQRASGKDIQDTSGDYEDGYANIWDTTKKRVTNLALDFDEGVTIEFWLKKAAALSLGESVLETIFDVWNGDDSSAGYGRLQLLHLTAIPGILGVYCNSGSVSNTSLTTTSYLSLDDQWHHYAISLKNNDSNLITKFYKDGACIEEEADTIINEITGSLIADIGSARRPSIVRAETAGLSSAQKIDGYGKLSGSLDEFRFWKTERTSQQIGRQMIEPVGGGTNTDDANTTLGVYYKFNEGITLTSSVDSTILDYSGRISNGTFEGYNSDSRNTGSAMVASGKANKEFKDPILYSFHPDVRSLKETRQGEGRIYDYSNNASIYHSLPTWIIEEDEVKEHSPLRNLTQIIGSYFDTLASQIESIPKFKHKNYLSSSFKPYPFADRLLESVGFSYFPELFSDATALQHFRNRDDVSLFKQKLYDVKNRIYQNIYNNIVYIYKTKGTEKSFRNLIRCFGLDNEVYKINTYGNRVTYQLKDNYESVAEFKKYANFSLVTTKNAVVFPFSSSTNPNSTSFISASLGDALETTGGLALTMESEVVFPRRHSLAASNTVAQVGTGSSKSFRAFSPFRTASLFGMHQVEGTAENNLTWASTDYANFQVYAIRDTEFSKRCQFVLTGTADSVIPTLSSSYFNAVFDDTRWNFSVAIKPTKYPEATLPSGSSGSTWDVEFYGVEKVLDTIKNEFFVTSSITTMQGTRFMTNPKSVYIGAHRTNFSGGLLQSSDGNISSTRVWMTHLPTGAIKQHAQDVKNYGSPNPYKSAYLYQTTMTGTRVPEIHTLALNWEFSTLTTSDASGEFVGQDFSSGSTSLQNRYNWIGNIIGKQYLPKGYAFPTNSSSSINRKYIYSAKKQLPEMINSSDMVNVLEDDDKFFNKVDLARPTNYYMYIEKSMYQTISEEMIKIFSSIKDFNNLIGEPVNKYRDNYKHMEKLRSLFFERVSNTADLDKYIDFYKWVDQTLDSLLGNLVPASADISDQYGSNIRTLVESHVLERNKYKWQYPTLEDKTPSAIEGHILGINELTYNWEFGHSGSDQDKKCRWWKERAERTDALASGDTNVDNDKQTILDSINNETNASDYTLYDNANSAAYSGSTYAIRRLAKPYKFDVRDTRAIKGGINFHPNKKVTYYKESMKRFNTLLNNENIIITELYNLPNCPTNLSGSNKVIKFPMEANNWRENSNSTIPNSFSDAAGSLLAPFNIVSSSVGPQTGLNDLRSLATLTNIHHDVYGPDYEHPMQGLFTEKHVGGNQHRHHLVNTGSDQHPNRPEAFSIDQEGGAWSTDGVTLVSPLRSAADGTTSNPDANLPRAVFFREPMAKRPVNIRNIQQATGSRILGNYSKDYEILMTSGRAINNRYFVKNEGVSGSATDILAVSGVLDYNLPGGAASAVDRTQVVKNGVTSSVRNDYIIVNRFSAPGDPSTMGLGFLDIESQEYSIYNALPWRNLIVRESLHELFIDHTKQFGFFSDTQNSASYVLAGETYPGTSGSVSTANYDGSASFHKVNKNPRRVIKFNGTGDKAPIVTGTVYDNWYIQHQIPQTDLQYAWITSSIINDYTGSALFGFEQPNFDNASLASTDITFVTASATGAFGINVDFVGLNTLVYDPVTSSLNILSASNNDYRNASIASIVQPNDFNSLILHRQGPYGWPSWKQTRGANHPIIRAHRKENRLSFAKNISIDGPPPFDPPELGIHIFREFGGKNRDILVSQIEPPLSSKFKPVTHNLQIKTGWGETPNTNTIKVRHSYGNEKTNFPQKVSGSIDLDKVDYIYVPTGQAGQLISDHPKTLIYDSLHSFITKPSTANPIEEFINLQIEETIYPREHYTHLKSTRQRDNFANSFWRDTRNARNTDLSTIAATTSSQNHVVSQSMWPLDGRSDISTSALTSSYGIEGELQNGYSLFFSPTDINTDFRSPMPAATYARRIPESHSNDNANVIFAGDTAWEAATQAGVNPFYNDYASYVEELKRIGKDYGIVPEYRISEQMNYLWTQIKDGSGDFDNPPTSSAYLTLTGSTLSSSDDKTFYTVYTYSDFMKHFKEVQDDGLQYGAVPTELTLECEALIKFLPYDGFYPAQRTVQLAELFSQSYGPTAVLAGDDANWRTAMAPLFSPGILYNSIKSGIAVDYPIATGSVGHNLFITGTMPAGGFTADTRDDGDPRLSGTFDYRVPFEALIDPLDANFNQVIDTEPHPSASINSTASFNSAHTPLYGYAINNFLAEVPSFFLKNGALTSLTSGKDINTITATPNTDYKMRIACNNGKVMVKELLTDFKGALSSSRFAQTASFVYNTPGTVMYNRSFHTSSGEDFMLRHVGKKSRTVSYGSSFGPPCDAPYRDGPTLLSESHFDAFTPSYYNGYSHIQLTFRSGMDGKMNISDIKGALTPSQISVFRETTRESGSGEGTCAGRNAMSITASLNWGQVVSTDDPISGEPGAGGDRWVIQPKWECPILDFNSSSITLPTYGSGSVAKGMWHQYSSVVPGSMNSIYMSVQDVPGLPEEQSLRKLLGFNATNSWASLGLPAQKKTISEAVVAIPFWPDTHAVTTGGKNYFNIDINTIHWAEQLINVKKGGLVGKKAEAELMSSWYLDGQINPEVLEFKPAKSVIDMVKTMKKYVIPPQFDFLRPGAQIDPFAMFVFEFETTLTRNDLINIWQNLPPNDPNNPSINNKSLSRAVTKRATAPFSWPNKKGLNLLKRKDLLEEAKNNNDGSWKGYDLLNERPAEGTTDDINSPLPDPADNTNLPFPSEVQWLVFKVKQKAKTNYYNLTATIDSEDDNIPYYSFNWPYDFFSLVEMIKINAAYKLESDPTNPYELSPPLDPNAPEEEIIMNSDDETGIPFNPFAPGSKEASNKAATTAATTQTPRPGTAAEFNKGGAVAGPAAGRPSGTKTKIGASAVNPRSANIKYIPAAAPVKIGRGTRNQKDKTGPKGGRS